MQDLIKQKECAPYLKEIVDILYNPFRLFHFCPPSVDFPSKNDLTLLESFRGKHIDETWNAFLVVLEQLEQLNGGNQARVLWEDFEEHCNQFFVPFYIALVNKDESEFVGWHQWDQNGFEIPHFDVQLCGTFKPKRLAKMHFPWYAEPKLDGLRGVIVNGRAFSRKGKEMYNCEFVLKEVEKLGLEDYALDGEFFFEDWNKSLSILKSQKPHKEANKLKFWVFDMIPVKAWEKGKCSLALKDRRTWMVDHVPADGRIKRVPYTSVFNQKEITKALNYFTEQGFEGTVIKDPKSLYKFKRSNSWLKVKSFEDGDYPIVGVKEGRGKYRGTLGALVINMDGRECQVGSGLKDKDRDRLWKMRKTLPGMIVEVKFQEKTFEKDGALRFPVFNRLREDK